MRLGATGAVVWGAALAGALDIAAVFAFWAMRDVAPATVLQSIASAVLGRAAYEQGPGAAALGLALHFAVSLTFAAAYVVASGRVRVLRSRPAVFGLAYGALAYVIMTFVVVPLSLMDARPWPPPLVNLAASIFIHLFLFGLPIALVASRIGAGISGAKPHEQPS
jgi:uncharacterized membrane protein YagU involved in acid resistance